MTSAIARTLRALVAVGMLAGLVVLVPVRAAQSATASTGTFFPLPPARILDTRSGEGAPAAPVGPGATLHVGVTGWAGVPATDVSAVVLNITAVGPTAAGYMTVWPTGEAMPTASSLNYVPGQTVPNLVKVKVGISGQVSVFNAAGHVHVVADVAGWYREGYGATEGARFTSLTPSRILDTRTGNGAPAATVGPGRAVELQVTGRGGVPANGVSAVAMNVTSVGPTAPSSYLTVWPTGEPRPTASNLNYVAGDVVPNLVIVKVGAGGRVSLYNDSGHTHVLSDVVGWYSGPAGAGRPYQPLTPSRILDTRTGNGAPAVPVGPGAVLDLQVTGRGGVPATGVVAVAANVTVVGPTAASYLTVWPAGEARPTASSLNYRPGQVVPNQVVVKVGAGGTVSLYNDAGQAHLVVDVVGWFGDAPPQVEVRRALTASALFFDPSNVVAPAGAQVTMTFTNADAAPFTHTFTSPAIGVDHALDGGTSTVFSFMMPGRPTEFFCSFHRGGGMVGMLTPG